MEASLRTIWNNLFGMWSPEASDSWGRDDYFPVPHFRLYQLLPCSLFGVSFRLGLWLPVAELC